MTPRIMLACLGVLASGVLASGQTVPSIYVLKFEDRAQTGDGSTSLVKYQLEAAINAPTSFTPNIIWPGGNPNIFFTGSSGNWGYASANFGTLGGFNAVHANGTYQVQASGGSTPISLNLTGDAYVTSPQISGGTWIDNKLQVNNTGQLTLNFGAFSGAGSEDVIAVFIQGPGHNTGSVKTSDATFHQISAGALQVGQTYDVRIEFINFVDQVVGGPSNGSFNGLLAGAGYVTAVEFQMTAIPEPSTYAALLALIVLGGVAWQRRRLAA